MEHRGTVDISTERLLLRRFVVGDAKPMLRNWASDPEVTHFLTWEPHASIDVTRALLEEWVRSYERLDFYQWAIVPHALGEPIGSISVVGIERAVSSAEIGYCIGRPWWHQGFTGEALVAVVDHMMREVGCGRVCAKHDARNPNSGLVMRHAGMSYEGTLRQAGASQAGIGDLCVYSILRSEWQELRRGEGPLAAEGTSR